MRECQQGPRVQMVKIFLVFTNTWQEDVAIILKVEGAPRNAGASPAGERGGYAPPIFVLVPPPPDLLFAPPPRFFWGGGKSCWFWPEKAFGFRQRPFFFGDHLILARKNVWICDFGSIQFRYNEKALPPDFNFAPPSPHHAKLATLLAQCKSGQGITWLG